MQRKGVSTYISVLLLIVVVIAGGKRMEMSIAR